MKNKISIYVATHKKFHPPHEKFFIPIVCGKKQSKDNLSYIGDDTGDNISHLNYCFSELTALYWIWKNDQESDIIGLAHYKRFFSKKTDGINLFVQDEIDGEPTLIEKKEIGSVSDFDLHANKVDIIVSEKAYIDNILLNYRKCHKIEDFFLVEQQIKKKYPEYMDAYRFALENFNFLYTYNMFVAKKEILHKYCEWLFGILLPLSEKKFFLSYNDYQKRIFGFLSERLFGIWLLHNRDTLVIEERPVIIMPD